jgi:hypothetical protein
MRKKGNMVRYWADELAATKARGEDRTDLASIAAKTEAELAATWRATRRGRRFPPIG